jgi:hypothetical protein
MPFSLSACSQQKAADPDAQFASVIGARLEPQLELRTQKKQFAPSDPIGLLVLNRTGKTIFFEDQSFSVRAYKYDTRAEKWVPVSLGFYILFPEQLAVPPIQETTVPPSYVMNTNLPPGKIRLVIVGWTEQSKPADTRIAAYTEIEILRQ